MSDRAEAASLENDWTRRSVSLAAMAFLAVGLAACGKKNDPVAPKGREGEFPRKFPSE